MRPYISLLLFTFSLVGCVEYFEEEPPSVVQGMRPIYGASAIGQVISMPPRAFVDLGAILAIGDYVLLVENGLGIHVIDNSNPNNPVTVAFLDLAGASQITSDGDYIYASIINDLYVLDIADWQSVTIVQIQENIFDVDPLSLTPPDTYFGYFECVDEAKGTVVGWRSDVLMEPRCRT